MVKQHLWHTHRFVWLLIALIIFSTAAGFVGIFAPNSISSALSDSKDKLVGLFSPGESNTIGPFEISADLELKPLDISKADNVRIELANTDKQISVNSEKLDLSELENSSLELQSFNGVINISETAVFSGESSLLSINRIRVLPESKNLNVNLDAKYSLIQLTLQLARFSYTSTGKIELNSGQIALQLDNEKLELHNFSGNFTISSGRLQIKGTADDVKVAGKALTVNIQ